MSMLLIYSPKCNHCRDIVQFVTTNSSLKQIVSYHDIHVNGIPQQYKNKITSVPTLLTKNGKLLVGSEVKQFLISLLPCEISHCHISGGFGGTLLEGEDNDGFFCLDNYGQTLQPAMTRELQDKINKNVNEAYDQVGR